MSAPLLTIFLTSMPKITLILLILSLLGCGKEKEPLPKQVELDTSSKPAKEECDSSCEAKNREEIKEKERHKEYLRRDGYFKNIKEKYEDLFEKSIPKCKECEDCDIEAQINEIGICIDGLKNAFDLGVPYPIIEEKTTWDKKIKAAYNNRFGLLITDFELSIIGVYYETYEGGISDFTRVIIRGFNHPAFSLVRTATGVKAKYYDYDTDFSTGDWLDFIMALRKCKVDKWDTVYMAPRGKSNGYNGSWVLEVYYLDKDGYINKHKTESYEFEGEYAPPNWKDFNRTLRKTEAKIERMAKAKAKAK